MADREQFRRGSAVGREVVIIGLPEWQRELAQARRNLPGEMLEADMEAAEMVAAQARRRAPRGPHLGGGRVQPIVSSIRAGAGLGGGFVSIGGPDSPHAVVTEFGGTLERYHSRARTEVRAQPYLYPSIAALSREIDELYLDAIEDAFRRAFPRRDLALVR